MSDEGIVTVHFSSPRLAKRAELNFTRDVGAWVIRKWETIPAQLDVKKGIATARIPRGTSVYYVNIVDEKGLVASSRHVDVWAEE